MIVIGPVHAPAMAIIHAAVFPPGEAWDATSIAVQLRHTATYGLLSGDGGMALARIAGDDSELLTLAVVPAARRGGLGRALLQAAMQEAARRGAGAMFLEVAEANRPARALYAGTGFEPVGRRPAYYRDGTDALVLRARLGPAVAAAG